jgi:hypothetical protein
MNVHMPQGNGDCAWSRFDPETYIEHYYAQPHPDDDQLLVSTCAALAGAAPDGRSIEVLDVGTGPNLFPLFAALPVAHRITVWEYASSNIDWLHRELARGVLRPPWTRFWKVARGAHGPLRATIDNPILALRDKTKIVQGSIFDLPPAQWDAATMFYCAESITARQEEFELACRSFARAVRSGGVIVAAFLANSQAYQVAQEVYPAIPVDSELLEHVFRHIARDISIATIGNRSGYTGTIVLSARSI